MHCPRCDSTRLVEREREGLTVDLCPECRGLWLDRGELERLLARAQREADESEARLVRAVRPARPWDDDDDHRRVDDRRDGDPRRRRRWFDALGEMFD
jgi:Zn-finger nucleic acid-binding protein